MRTSTAPRRGVRPLRRRRTIRGIAFGDQAWSRTGRRRRWLGATAAHPAAGSSRAPAWRAARRSAATAPAPPPRPRRAPARISWPPRRSARAGSARAWRRRPAPRPRSRCAAPAPRAPGARRRRSCVEWMIDFSTGICRGAIDSWRRPSPIRIHASSGSPAMSPHIATGLLARAAPSTICLSARRIAGCSGW